MKDQLWHKLRNSEKNDIPARLLECLNIDYKTVAKGNFKYVHM